MEKAVNFQEAVFLNILGFKEEVDQVYNLNDKYSELLEYGKSLCGDDELYAPTYEQAFKWLVAENAEIFTTLAELREHLLREAALEKAFIASSKMETDRSNRD